MCGKLHVFLLRMIVFVSYMLYPKPALLDSGSLKKKIKMFIFFYHLDTPITADAIACSFISHGVIKAIFSDISLHSYLRFHWWASKEGFLHLKRLIRRDLGIKICSVGLFSCLFNFECRWQKVALVFKDFFTHLLRPIFAFKQPEQPVLLTCFTILLLFQLFFLLHQQCTSDVNLEFKFYHFIFWGVVHCCLVVEVFDHGLEPLQHCFICVFLILLDNHLRELLC